MNLMDLNAYKRDINIHLFGCRNIRIQKNHPKIKFTELMKWKELRFPLNIDTVDSSKSVWKVIIDQPPATQKKMESPNVSSAEVFLWLYQCTHHQLAAAMRAAHLHN